jgi:hypothetical protein
MPEQTRQRERDVGRGKREPSCPSCVFLRPIDFPAAGKGNVHTPADRARRTVRTNTWKGSKYPSYQVTTTGISYNTRPVGSEQAAKSQWPLSFFRPIVAILVTKDASGDALGIARLLVAP